MSEQQSVSIVKLLSTEKNGTIRSKHITITKYALLTWTSLSLSESSGVFAARTLTKGEFLLEYKGDFIEGNDDVDTGFKFYFKHNEKMLCIDATNAEGLGRMVNDHPGHKANCRMRKILLSGGKPRLCLFAVKDISEGDELRFDYGVSNLPWRKEKRCRRFHGQEIHLILAHLSFAQEDLDSQSNVHDKLSAIPNKQRATNNSQGNDSCGDGHDISGNGDSRDSYKYNSRPHKHNSLDCEHTSGAVAHDVCVNEYSSQGDQHTNQDNELSSQGDQTNSQADQPNIQGDQHNSQSNLPNSPADQHNRQSDLLNSHAEQHNSQGGQHNSQSNLSNSHAEQHNSQSNLPNSHADQHINYTDQHISQGNLPNRHAEQHNSQSNLLNSHH